jgi:hypothetical protein
MKLKMLNLKTPIPEVRREGAAKAKQPVIKNAKKGFNGGGYSYAPASD